MLPKIGLTLALGLCIFSGNALGNKPAVENKLTADRRQIKEPESALSGYAGGMILGGPSGLSASASFEDIRINGALAWGSSSSDSYFYLHIDGVKEYPMEEDVKGASLYRYFGVGLKTVSRSSTCDDCKKSSTGVRLPLGLKAKLKEFPVNIFAELSPGLALIPTTEIDIDVALGARYRF